MTSVKNHRPAKVVISASAAVFVLNMLSTGSGRTLLADNITKNLANSGIDIQTHTDQKQECQTAGESSPIVAGATTGSPSTTGTGQTGLSAGKAEVAAGGSPGSCSATSTDTVTQSGGVKK
jgi:hypothetical protein